MRGPLTDWDGFYLRLRTSKLGDDYPRKRFLRTPISLLKKAYDFISNQEQAEANRAAMTQAAMTDLMLKIAHGFSGSKKKAPNTKPKDFLPYPDYRPLGTAADEADAPTKFILTELVKRFAIPIHVFVALNGRVDDQR